MGRASRPKEIIRLVGLVKDKRLFSFSEHRTFYAFKQNHKHNSFRICMKSKLGSGFFFVLEKTLAKTNYIS
ncbi:hypothetical protein ASG93_32060 [Paenibacillus sp. Soil787]|nr:hypothetical protein ASG93_32060 [Paenibacillus sp. Soil787]